ncbi:hypothetical protein JCM6292_29 [Bacteroides pyogenes JCM 6292]|uniref:Uncharacterized protein n=2 Tax=Bacteroides pyogenes TaxID=310300 RepID=W4PDM3_9BACE|nr:hypothetical protein JCM6292_29 [Bacteroides pyogenes JCM 6292]GAE17468.1 hypothetical protein JCM6294_217 [Bacteroides pyogenes DSM 20611 = JCM 6294]
MGSRSLLTLFFYIREIMIRFENIRSGKGHASTTAGAWGAFLKNNPLFLPVSHLKFYLCSYE